VTQGPERPTERGAKPASVRVTIYVEVDPMTAFEVFTDEIDLWYKRGPHNFFDPVRAIAIRFEGGRLVEVYDNESGECREMARVTAWDPGRRLVMVDHEQTEIEVTFSAVAGRSEETKVVLEHRGLERLPSRVAEKSARFGGRLLIAWFSEHMRERTAT
jgi:hypothetical protein